MINFFNLTLSKKHFICPSILNESFVGLLLIIFDKMNYCSEPIDLIVFFTFFTQCYAFPHVHLVNLL